VSYWDEFIAVYDIMTCKTLASTSAHLVKIAIAPNGKTFAGSDASGDIRIFDFETLQFLHRIPVEGDPVTSLVFTGDSLRIINTRGTHANIWEPLVLASQDSDSQCSERSESVHQIVEDVGASIMEQAAAITSLHCCDENGMALCGRDDGWVDVCDLDDPENTMRHLYRHRGAINSVTCIDWACKPGIAASADCLGIFRVMKITTKPRGEWRAETVAEAQLENRRRITQILVHPDGSHVLISSPEIDTVWSILTKQAVATITDRRRTAWKWFVRSSAPSQLILFEDAALRVFHWTDLAELATAEASDLPTPAEKGPTADADAISISSDGNDVVFIQKMHQYTPLPQAISPHPSIRSKIHVFDLSLLSAVDLGLPSQSSQPLSRAPSRPPPYSNLPPKLNNPFVASPSDSPLPITTFAPPGSAHARRRSCITNVAEIPGLDSIIGTVKKFNSWFLIFISREGWVCSLELGPGGTKSIDTFQKHFFIPSVWRTATSSLITKVCRCQDIVFVYQNDVIVVKNGLDNGKRVSFSQA
jgi:WD40 repeat protein